jgi:hypothetical protein
MSEERDKSSIFLSIVIVFLLVAMGVYGFIYRDKLTEFFQKFQKKNEQVEKHTIYNNNSLDEKKESAEVSPVSEKSEVPPIQEKEKPKEEIEDMIYENATGDDPLIKQNKSKSKLAKLDYTKNIPQNSTVEVQEKGNKPKLEFVKSKKSKGKLSKSKKRKYTKLKKSPKKTNSLLKRVSRLERAMGIKSSKKESLEKRLIRLEKALGKKKE